MILCFYGRSLAGKTTLARQLATGSNVPLRCCGDEVRKKAIELKVGIGQVPNEEHFAVDQATRTWVSGNQPCIVEGRFLDAVLSVHKQKDTQFIEVTASQDVRLQRAIARGELDSESFTADSLKQRDLSDVAFRSRLFPNFVEITPAMSIDTSKSTIKECTQRIRHAFSMFFAND
jgi:cytidylate kinase